MAANCSHYYYLSKKSKVVTVKRIITSFTYWWILVSIAVFFTNNIYKIPPTIWKRIYDSIFYEYNFIYTMTLTILSLLLFKIINRIR